MSPVPIFRRGRPVPPWTADSDRELAERLIQWLTGLEYKPGWAVTVKLPTEMVSEHDSETLTHVSVIVSSIDQDVNGRTGHVEIDMPIAVPGSATWNELLAAVFSVIACVESHERLEHFRIGDACVYLPHDEEGNPLVWRGPAPGPDWLSLNRERGYWIEETNKEELQQ